MKYTTKKKMYITERDNSPAKYCITGDYYKIDPNLLNFAEWKKKCLALDPDVDFTYWEFDIKFSKDMKEKFKDADEYFVQQKYIITNRRMVHVFSNDPYYHASGFHTKPKNIIEFLNGLYGPDSIQFFKGRWGPSSYMLKNDTNKNKSFLNIHNDKYLKIQTSYFTESISIITDMNYVFTDDIELFDQEVTLNESYLAPLQDKYLLVEKFLYTYNPNVIALGNSVSNYDGVRSITLDDEQIPLVLEHTEFIEKEVGCHYLIEGNDLTLILI